MTLSSSSVNGASASEGLGGVADVGAIVPQVFVYLVDFVVRLYSGRQSQRWGLPAQLPNVAVELVDIWDHDLLNALVDDGLLAGKEPACVRHDHADVELPPEGAIPEVILGSRLKGMSADDLDVASYLVGERLRRPLDVVIRVSPDLAFTDVTV